MFYILSLSLCFRSKENFLSSLFLLPGRSTLSPDVVQQKQVYCYCYFYFLTYISRGVIFNLYFKRLSCTFETVFSLFIKLEASKYRTVICRCVFICFHFCVVLTLPRHFIVLFFWRYPQHPTRYIQNLFCSQNGASSKRRDRSSRRPSSSQSTSFCPTP